MNAVHQAAHLGGTGNNHHTVHDWLFAVPAVPVEDTAIQLHAESYPHGPSWFEESLPIREHYLRTARVQADR